MQLCDLYLLTEEAKFSLFRPMSFKWIEDKLFWRILSEEKQGLYVVKF